VVTIPPGITGKRPINSRVGGRGCSELEPLAVSPNQACLLLGIGNTRLYQLIGNGELQSYRDGRARRITLASIRQRVSRLLAAEGTSRIDATGQLSRGRRPRKMQEQTHHER
jgi:excisionase family DNA binding protein